MALPIINKATVKKGDLNAKSRVFFPPIVYNGCMHCKYLEKYREAYRKENKTSFCGMAWVPNHISNIISKEGTS